jgi:GDP-L-fucose synthase
LAFDACLPNGTPRKLVDVSRMKQLAWQAGIPLRQGRAAVYREYLGCFAERVPA